MSSFLRYRCFVNASVPGPPIFRALPVLPVRLGQPCSPILLSIINIPLSTDKPSPLLNQCCKVVRQAAGEVHLPARDRMDEAQSTCMQCLPVADGETVADECLNIPMEQAK